MPDVPNIILEEEKLLVKLSRIAAKSIHVLERAQSNGGELSSDQIRDMNVIAQTVKNLRELRVNISGERDAQIRKTTTADLARMAKKVVRARAKISMAYAKNAPQDPEMTLSKEDEEEMERFDEPIEGENAISMPTGPK